MTTSARLPWRVGAGMTDITPPLEVGILMSSLERRWEPFEGVRRPLHARAVVMQRGSRRVALVALDLLGVSGKAFGGRARFKNRIVTASGNTVRPGNLLLAATHSHSAPETLALTDLCHTAAFQAWVETLAERIGQAVREAAASARPCRLAVGTGTAPGHGVYRRIHTTQGILLNHPPIPPEIILSQEGPTDDSVNVAAFLDEAGQPVALLVNATCHPVHEMCLPQISPDYPGEMSIELEHRTPGTVALFLNGAAGNINPPTVSGGPADSVRHGHRLAETVIQTLHHLRPVEGTEFVLKRQAVRLPGRTPTGRPTATPLHTEVAALRLGEAGFVFLPGEPFVETGLAVRASSPYPFTAIVGYAEDSIGYIPTDTAFAEGGYETGPGLWAKVGPGSEPIYRDSASAALAESSGP
ncbi:MAG TPA: neutral/alkaline non-lysosomal ceramidase N-terminal domain-containing protein [Chthonomonadaceae bacterium]|nr:neutral/alkaline non-lysosomal ceramidase N-terminal domain-containing protein [Chthonomonadaceae bacterium]